MESMENPDVVVECRRENGVRDCGITIAVSESQRTLDFSSAGRRNGCVHFGQVLQTPASAGSSSPATLLDPCSVASGQPEFILSSSPSLADTQPVHSIPRAKDLSSDQLSQDVRHSEAMVASLENRLLEREQLQRESGQQMEALRTAYDNAVAEKNDERERLARAQFRLLSLERKHREHKREYKKLLQSAEEERKRGQTAYQQLEADKSASETSLHYRIAALEEELSSLREAHRDLRTQSKQLTKNSQDEVSVLRQKLTEIESLLIPTLQCHLPIDERCAGDILQTGFNVRKVVLRAMRALRELKAQREKNVAQEDKISQMNAELAPVRVKRKTSTIQRDKLLSTGVVTNSALHPEDSVVVEVLGRDGVLQCGKAIVRSTSKVLVDFCCANKRSEWITLDQAFISRLNFYYGYSPLRVSFYHDQGVNDQVEVLMQQRKTEPWKWQPATVLVFDWQHRQFAWVAIHLPDGDVKTIVAQDRIRRPAPRISLASELQEETEDGNAEKLRQLYSKTVLRGENAYCTKGKKRGHRDVCLATAKRRKVERGCRDAFASSVPGAMRPIPALVLDDISGIRFLPVEILAEALQYLHTVDQCRLRTVCAGWNAILTSIAVKNVLHIQFPSEHAPRRPRVPSVGSVYVAVACAHHCWSNRAVAIVGSPVADNSTQLSGLANWPLCDGLFLREIIRGGAEKFPRNLIMRDVRFHVPWNSSDSISDLCYMFDSLVAICGTLIVKNFTCVFRPFFPDGGVSFTIRIPFGRMSSDRRLTVADCWNMFEQRCPLLDDQQKSVLYTAIKDSTEDGLLERKLVMVLDSWQSEDPRKTSTYLKPFPEGGDPLELVDVNRLSRMVQYIMYCVITKTISSFDIAWPTS